MRSRPVTVTMGDTETQETPVTTNHPPPPHDNRADIDAPYVPAEAWDRIPPAPPPASGLAVAALVCGITGVTLGLTTPLLYTPVLALGAVATALGAIAWHQRRQLRAPIALAVAGTILGIASLITGAVGWNTVTTTTTDIVNEIEDVPIDTSPAITQPPSTVPDGSCVRRDETGNTVRCAAPTIDRGSS